MKPFTKIAALIFALLALAHAGRLFLNVLIMVGSHPIPMWVSVGGIIIPLILSIGLWREAK